MGCCDSSTQHGRDGGIFRAGAGIVEGDAAARRGAGRWLGGGAAGAGNSASAQNVLDIDDHRKMNSPTTGQGSAARWLLLLFVRFYQIFLSPFLGGACKFYPSCSRYAQEAIAVHGARRGAWLAMKRLGRCRPFTKGGFDPVPEYVDGRAAHLSERKLRTPENRAFDCSDADWLRTASKEQAQ
ncbi:MAG: membrane protein insertion efficiency factor YidD [Candidatus Acidiferrales bacterium]